ncbi:MAG: hypothetical protein PCFJNLEI_00470 [Verrucomicrobiae bacterium]|nr:hypothetical protein [Verrucomicrobiae bacterium]
MKLALLLACLLSLPLLAQQPEPPDSTGSIVTIQADDFDDHNASPPVDFQEVTPEQWQPVSRATAARLRRKSTRREATTAAAVQHQTLVMVINFQDAPHNCDLATLNALLFAESDSVAALYAEMSAGAVAFTGDVVGPFTINFSNADPDCAYFAWAAAADAAAVAAGIPLGHYQHKVYVLPRHSQCGWTGLATIGGNPSRAWVMRCHDAALYAHELGHNLGLLHAAADYNNDGLAIDEYGDGSDIMGRTGHGLRQLNAPHREQLGWLPPGKIVLTADPLLVHLAPLAQTAGQTPAPQVLKIPQPGSNRAYYFSYRRPLGSDTNLLTAFRDTLSVHHCMPGAVQPYLITTLTDDTPFIDATTGLTVTMRAHNDAAAIVQLTYECYATPPKVVLASPAVCTLPGSATTTSVTISNAASAPCPPTHFQFRAAAPRGWTATLDPATLLLAPGQTGTAQLRFVPPEKNPPPTATITVTVAAVQNPAQLTTVDQCIVITKAAKSPDTTAPTPPVNMQAKQKKQTVRLRWNPASDNVAVAGYTIWRNGQILTQTKSCRFSDRTIVPGTIHEYSVSAFDHAGNMSPSSSLASVMVD